MEKICVAVRVRPPVSSNEDKFNGTFWKIGDNHISLHRHLGTPISGISYVFDHVFDESCSNSRVYDLLTKDIIHSAVEGFNGTCFAYGQTSSGKTFTMNGSENDPGIIQRAVRDVFERIHKNDDREFLIRVSYMEIYNEEINDLLVINNQKLPIHESLERGVFVAGIREEIVNEADQVLKLLEAGEVNRHFGETNMNVRSSRSHTIFRMVIESKGKETDDSNFSDYWSSDAIRVSTLNLVDLAGSERIAKTGADGVRLKEGKYINKSLMVLGNVINKLSEGAKQRGHIPYRDSKLTRILQSALGGNAKTSIICTVAPEEVHIEETKGTLQFATRAKRITNCAQVNEILTDAALLKRQKLEIEELREKLQGSRAEVLEQEIFKLRSDLLKYELEKEKLATELEEERKLHKETDERVKVQHIKIENLSNLVNITNSNGKLSAQTHDQEDTFRTPTYRAAPKTFVSRRSNYSALSDSSSSPFPDTFSNVADEDAWMKMNNGYVADLDSIKMTPAIKYQSVSSIGVTPISRFPSMVEVKCTFPQLTNNYLLNKQQQQEVEDLRKQLELATKEKLRLEREHADQVELNIQLNRGMRELQREVQVLREFPKQFIESVATCKDIYNDVLSYMQNSIADQKPFATQLISSTSEIGANLFSTLESHFKTAIDNHRSFSVDRSLLREQCTTVYEKLNKTVTFMEAAQEHKIEEKVSKSFQHSTNHKDDKVGIEHGGETACWKENLCIELYRMKDNHICLVKDIDLNNQVLEVSREKYHELETQLHHLTEERDSLAHKVLESNQELSTITGQRERIMKSYDNEVKRRKDLEEEIKCFSVAFASRQKSFASFHIGLKSRVESVKAQVKSVGI
ncbi:hypothetical protein V2J09_021905 [Rumex salicifolius]